ncbi:MAG: ATP-binding protein [Bacilli bacterium]|nr:ATP-binding protein [Bacilli bacterium]
MERKIESFLQKWKNDLIRKPLVVYGPKQVGKTFTILNFGKGEYKNCIYFDSNNNKQLIEIFKKERSVDKLIISLSLLSGETILENDSLLVFDNVNDIEIIRGLKLFGNGNNPYHIIAITSRRENLHSFKGIELQFKGMTGMDFEEYLWVRDERQLADLIRESFEKKRTCPFHKVALDMFYEYLVTGGLPEVILSYINGASDNEIKAIKGKIIDSYIKEIALNPTLIDISRGIEVLNSIPLQLQKENRKFQYGLMGYGKRAKEYDTAIKYLVDNQLVCRSYKIRTVKSPLSSCRETDSFKLYLVDEGILFSMMHLNRKSFLYSEQMKETLYENHIAKTLMEAGYSLYYYQSDGKAEVNFVVQNRMGQIIPIEITIKAMSKAKSLSVLMKKHTVFNAYRITENNFSTKKEVRYIPIYAVFCLNDNKI